MTFLAYRILVSLAIFSFCIKQVSSGNFDEARKDDFTPKFTTVSVNGKTQDAGKNVFFVNKGDEVKLTCKCREKEQYGQLGFSINQKISKTENNTKVISLDDSLTEEKRTYVYNYQSTTSDYILELTIPSMEFEDSGKYICRNLLTGSINSHIDDVIELAVLNIEEPLRFIANDKELSNTFEISTKNLNSNVNFTCVSNGFPKPDITFYRIVKGKKEALPNLKVAVDNEIIKSNNNKYYSSIFDMAVYIIHKLSANDYDAEFGCESVYGKSDNNKVKNIVIELPDDEPIIIFENMKDDVKIVRISKENAQYSAVFHVLSKTSLTGHILLTSKDNRQERFNMTVARKLSGSKFELTVRIPSLEEWHLVADGMLHVTNDRGTTTEKIKLHRNNSGPVKGVGGKIQFYWISIFATYCLFLLILV